VARSLPFFVTVYARLASAGTTGRQPASAQPPVSGLANASDTRNIGYEKR